ncbi:CopD family protein [Streptomyces griseoviridis]|uniref:Copper export protein n=2 Tax=Streptomyces griseoviridis TaxID=45398 RepID=A0ABT9LEV3_STRGD|nr:MULTISPECIES: CopD family protein [Streptomyces]MDP9681021.1 putative copper export protein [Streptomyces griseoviridis]GGS57225.1 membrane protein [Streptomyces niveoruber]GGT10554.1 membrane protein [Streptomyces griseoviridis]
MTLIRPTPPSARPRGHARPRSGNGRAVAVLVLVALAALVPLLGPAPALAGTGEAAAPGTGGIALLRTVLFAALAVPVGELFAGRLARRLDGAPPLAPRSWSPYAAAAGFAAALGLASVVAAGNLAPGSLTGLDLGGLYSSREGRLALLEVNAFLVAGLCAASRRPGTQVWPLAAVVVAEALRAHPPAEHTPLLGSGLTLLHLTCASLWVGGLLHVLRTLGRWRGSGAGPALLGLYARVAAVLLAVITATGVCSSLRRMPPGTVLEQLTDTAYGRVLLAKVLVVAAVAALALWARVRLGRAADPLAACSPARAEVAVLALVVAVSGLLTALPVPIRW